jgi:hypothetical protein
MLRSLDFLYMPAEDVDAAVTRCVEGLGALLVWRIEAMATVVAAVRVTAHGPLLLFADHLEGRSPIAIYRVDDYKSALERVRASRAGELREVEIPPGPCATFSLDGARLGLYELTRRGARDHLAQRGGG